MAGSVATPAEVVGADRTQRQHCSGVLRLSQCHLQSNHTDVFTRERERERKRGREREKEREREREGK